MSTPLGATFVMVRPAKAVELKDGFAQRVSPESSLHSVLSEVLDKSTGMRSSESFSTHVFPTAAVGLAQGAPEGFQTHSEKDMCVVVVGSLSNSDELRQRHLADESVEMNDAALIGKLYGKMQREKAKYAFVSELRGEFTLALYCAKSDNVLAARSPCGKYALSQGIDKKTGGLLVTNALLTSAHEMTEVPGGNFIFGKFRERILHPMHKDVEAAQTWRPMDSACRRHSEIMHDEHMGQPIRRSMEVPSSRRSASLDLPRVDQREAAFAAASRALAGLKINRTSLDHEPVASTSSLHAASEIPAAPKGRTTPSAKGTADKQTTWRRTSLEHIVENRAAEDQLATAAPPAPHRTSLSSRATTTPSAKGTADAADTWRKAPTAAAPDHAPAALATSWNPVAIGSFLADIADVDAAQAQPSTDAPAAAHKDSHALADYPAQGGLEHTELLSQALDEFMEGGALPRCSSIERCASADMSRNSYEDLLTLSRLSGAARGAMQIKSQKVKRRTSYKKVKDNAVGENTIAGSPNCGVSTGKRFMVRF